MMKYALLQLRREIYAFLKRCEYHVRGGYICTDGSKIPIYGRELFGAVNSQPFLFSYFTKDDNLYSKKTLYQKIEYYFETNWHYSKLADDEYNDRKIFITTCAVTGKIAPCARIIDDDLFDLHVRFGTYWWNGHYFSLEAFHKILMESDVQWRTSVLSLKNGKTAYVDRYGIKL